MSCYLIKVENGHKVARSITSEEEYKQLRGSNEQKANLRLARAGNDAAKRRLVQFNYSGHYPQGMVKGMKLPSCAFGFDMDEPEAFAKAAKLLLKEPDKYGLLMLERELIQERTQSALEVRKQKLAQDGEFISKSGKVVKKLGRPRKCDLSNAQKAASEKRKKEAAEKPCNKAIWNVVKKCTNDFTELTTPNFADAAMMLQQMGVYSSTGKVLTKELVRSAYYNLRSVYGSQVYFRRGSANYRVMREKGMTDEEIQQYYKELNNNNNNTEEV